jgi:LPXTG-motif cell wall-anchored protein
VVAQSAPAFPEPVVAQSAPAVRAWRSGARIASASAAAVVSDAPAITDTTSAPSTTDAPETSDPDTSTPDSTAAPTTTATPDATTTTLVDQSAPPFPTTSTSAASQGLDPGDQLPETGGEPWLVAIAMIALGGGSGLVAFARVRR